MHKMHQYPLFANWDDDDRMLSWITVYGCSLYSAFPSFLRQVTVFVKLLTVLPAKHHSKKCRLYSLIMEEKFCELNQLITWREFGD